MASIAASRTVHRAVDPKNSNDAAYRYGTSGGLRSAASWYRSPPERITWAWVARNVSSELKTSTKNPGSRKAKVNRSRIPNSRQERLHRFRAGTGAAARAGRGSSTAGSGRVRTPGAESGMRSMTPTVASGGSIQTFWPLAARRAGRDGAPGRGPLGGDQVVAEVLVPAPGPLQLPR